jgi:hypothetical protein
MILDGEVVTALQEAAEQEKGLRQRGKPPKVAIPVTMGAGPDAADSACGAGSC